MKRGIVVGTSEYTKDFLKPLLESIKETTYPILIVSNGGFNINYPGRCWPRNEKDKLIVNEKNGWEPAVIERGKENFDEFVHIMDSTLIKDITLFDKLFAIEGNVVLTKDNFHYMGKFVSKTIPKLPEVFSKDTAIMMETRWLPKPWTEFIPDLPVHTNVFEVIHGQKRMRLENDYMIKWKGTYQVSEEHPINYMAYNKK